MRIEKIVLLTIVLALVCQPLSAQLKNETLDPERAKALKERDERISQITEQSLVEVAGLRLPGNRAVVHALAADIYWRLDPERSRQLFRNAAADIQAHYQEAETKKMNPPAAGVSQPPFIDLRAEILPLVSRRDPGLALEMLVQTRPADVAEALARFPENAPAAAPGNPADPGRLLAARERSLEDRFLQQAAGADPEKSIKFIRESLARGVSANVLSVLQMLYQKDQKEASSMGAEVVSKILDTDLARKDADLRGALSILQSASRPAPPNVRMFAFSESQTREMANKLASTFLQVTAPSPAINSLMTQAMPLLEKLVPERSGQLKLRAAQNAAKAAASARPGQRRLWSPSSTPEEIAAALSKIQNPTERRSASSQLANKIAQITDEERARKLIDQIPDAGLRARAGEQFEAAKASRAASEGKLDEARGLIDAFSNRRMRVQRLVGLAFQYRAKGTPEALELAQSTMVDARSLVRDQPEDGEELQDLMEIVRGYSIIEPDTAFGLFEPLMPQFNEIIQASAVLDKYTRRSRSFDRGEIIMRINGTPADELVLFRYIPHIQALGRADLERTNSIVDRLARNDARALVKLLMLRAIS